MWHCFPIEVRHLPHINSNSGSVGFFPAFTTTMCFYVQQLRDDLTMTRVPKHSPVRGSLLNSIIVHLFLYTCSSLFGEIAMGQMLLELVTDWGAAADEWMHVFLDMMLQSSSMIESTSLMPSNGEIKLLLVQDCWTYE